MQKHWACPRGRLRTDNIDPMTGIADSEALAGSAKPRQRTVSLKNMLWGWLLILALGIAAGGCGMA